MHVTPVSTDSAISDEEDDDPYADYSVPRSKPLSIIRESRELSARISDQVAYVYKCVQIHMCTNSTHVNVLSWILCISEIDYRERELFHQFLLDRREQNLFTRKNFRFLIRTSEYEFLFLCVEFAMTMYDCHYLCY